MVAVGIAREVRELIRRMSFENSLWGATKIHCELLKLGIAVAQSTISVYMVPRRDRPLQTWKTLLRNHMEGIASIDLFVVPTIAFQQLFAFLVLGHKRRQLLWFAVTCNPTAEWLARQITEAHGPSLRQRHGRITPTRARRLSRRAPRPLRTPPGRGAGEDPQRTACDRLTRECGVCRQCESRLGDAQAALSATTADGKRMTTELARGAPVPGEFLHRV